MSDEKTLSLLLDSTGFSKSFSDQLFEDLNQVETLLSQGVRSDTNLPQDLALYLVKTGGKRLRPLLLCLCYRALESQNAHNSDLAFINTKLHTLATVAEWVHTATLFHDDVIDASEQRRDQPSAHILHGNKTAILVGDFVYAEAFAKLMDLGLLVPSQRLAHTVKKLVEGELLQHQISIHRTLDLNEYNQIAQSKTGALFAWCLQTGYWLSTQQTNDKAWQLGNKLGTAFQIADDFIDTYEFNCISSSEADLLSWKDGAPSLPVIVANFLYPEKGIAAIWRKLKSSELDVSEIRLALGQILSACSLVEVKQECLKLFKAEYDLAVSLAKELGLHQHLNWALDVILNRALTGLSLKNSDPVTFGSSVNV